MAVSRRRAIPRAMSMVPRFAQAMMSTIATVTRMNCGNINDERYPTPSIDTCAVRGRWGVYSAVRRTAMMSNSERTRSRDTPSFT